MLRLTRNTLATFLLVSLAQPAMAGSGGARFISYYEMILSFFGLHGHEAEAWKPVVGAAFTLLITLFVGLKYRAQALASDAALAPTSGLSLRNGVDMVADFVHNLAHNAIGDEKAKSFLPVLFGVFFFILVSNLTGLFPGLTPATDSINTNLVLGLFIFLVFNIAGIKEHGLFGYLKTFAGPIWWMMPALFCIEMIGMMARPVSLSLRLYGNIFGDHLVLSVFTDLTKLLLPSMLLFFGLLVACLQSFVFTLLSGIYISLATSHDH